VTGCVELADDVSADETGRTGDENGERFGSHSLRQESTHSRLCWTGRPLRSTSPSASRNLRTSASSCFCSSCATDGCSKASFTRFRIRQPDRL
jgi:hypothetical protein